MRAFFSCACLAALMFAGCGDDSGGTPTDAGVVDTGSRDSGGRDAGRRDSGPGMDSGPDEDGGRTGALPACDIFAPDCGEGEKCAVVLDSNDPMDTFIYFACVPTSTGEKAEGVLCASLNEDATPDDPTDSVETDECAEGLFCWTTGGATTTRCHPVCGSDDPAECGADQYCDGLNDMPFFGVCSDADNCSPIHQTGCTGGDACYYVLNGMERFLGSCFPFVPETDGGVGAPGDDCTFINNCAGGSQCLSDRLPDGGLAMERFCRQLCSRGATDGGMPMMDAGPMGGCPTGETCNDYPIEGTFAGDEIAGFCN